MPDRDANVPSTVFVLFGATGDLAKRMVLPAFYRLFTGGLLPRRWHLIGNGRGDVSHEDFRTHVHDVLKEFAPEFDETAFEPFAANLSFAGGGFDSDSPGSLLDVLGDVRAEMADAQVIHYFAVPPAAFGELTKALAQHNLAEGARVVYEKPYGTSQEDFESLDKTVHSVLDESQAYRIDHFLGKEATQNIHVLRYGNAMIDAIWNHQHVRAVQIDVPETLDIDDRAEFYDATGAFLDMIVTHLFELVAEVAMEPPTSFSADDLQSARSAVVAAFRPLDPADVVLGQYDGYREVEGIDRQSSTDTFVAARMWVDTDRWHGVPFYLRTGKRLAGDAELVTLVLDREDGPLTHLPVEGSTLEFDLKGSGALSLSTVLKKPGDGLALTTADLTVDLDAVSGDVLPPYARLIHDVMRGDRSLFTRPDGLAATWAASGPLLAHRPQVQPYEAGSWGPAAAVELIAPDRWVAGQ